MTRFRALAFILLALMATNAFPAPKSRGKTAAKTGSGDVLPFAAVERTLPNGLKVIVVPTGFPNIVSLQIPVQTGSRNEIEPGKSGFAHFFEHMMFRGTKAYPAEKYQGILTRVGARQNASTSDDFTNYYTTFSKEDLETMLEVEADRWFEEHPVAVCPAAPEVAPPLGGSCDEAASSIRRLPDLRAGDSVVRRRTRRPAAHLATGRMGPDRCSSLAPLGGDMALGGPGNGAAPER